MLENLSNIFKYLAVAGVIAFIAWLFPLQMKQNWKYEVGKVWQHENLLAPFDIPVQKSGEEIAGEKNRILKDIFPFYTMQKDVSVQQNKKIARLVNDSYNQLLINDPLNDLVKNKGRYITKARGILSHMYQKGIVQSDSLFENSEFINVVRKQEAKIDRSANLFSLEEARTFAIDSLSTINLKEKSNLLALIQQCIVANTYYDSDLTDRYTVEALTHITKTKEVIQKGDLIITKGQLITKELSGRLNAFEASYVNNIGNNDKRWYVFAGYLLLTCLLIGVYLFYIQFHAKDIFDNFRSLSFMLIWPVIFSFLLNVVEGTDNLSAYMIPYCIVPIVIKNFYSDRLALFAHIVIILIASFLSKEGYEFTFIQLVAGIVAILSIKETRYWNKFFVSIFLIFATYVLGYIGLDLLRIEHITEINLQPIMWFVIASILTLLAYPLIPLLERIFGFTSNISLAELSDLNSPLLKDMSIKAPGTLQHSLQVANLGEAAAEAVGANGLLVKTAALYHDVGKTKDPTYFIENQKGSNPHDQLTELESAKKIIAHVLDGDNMAKKVGLPSLLRRFIMTHHGTTRTEYFYRTYVNKNPDIEIDTAAFTYPGPLPESKEESILMLADSAEAAAKSLKNPTGQDLDQLIDSIFSGKIQQNQLLKSKLTFEDLEIVKHSFKEMLRNIHHVRIEYPSIDVQAKKDSNEQKEDK